METKNLQDLEIKVTIRSCEADFRLLADIAKVIVTSLHDQQGLEVALKETVVTEKTNSEKKLRIFSGTISL